MRDRSIKWKRRAGLDGTIEYVSSNLVFDNNGKSQYIYIIEKVKTRGNQYVWAVTGHRLWKNLMCMYFYRQTVCSLNQAKAIAEASYKTGIPMYEINMGEG